VLAWVTVKKRLPCMHPAVLLAIQASGKDNFVVCAEEMERLLDAAWDLIGGDTV